MWVPDKFVNDLFESKMNLRNADSICSGGVSEV
ncbi:hypothetical protein PM8797T_03364 [Gimesia maris DSM 8797]|nr:hypothetical protein PM8797T_03364 [Gimesia maris DSM 8797]